MTNQIVINSLNSPVLATSEGIVFGMIFFVIILIILLFKGAPNDWNK